MRPPSYENAQELRISLSPKQDGTRLPVRGKADAQVTIRSLTKTTDSKEAWEEPYVQGPAFFHLSQEGKLKERVRNADPGESISGTLANALTGNHATTYGRVDTYNCNIAFGSLTIAFETKQLAEKAFNTLQSVNFHAGNKMEAFLYESGSRHLILIPPASLPIFLGEFLGFKVGKEGFDHKIRDAGMLHRALENGTLQFIQGKDGGVKLKNKDVRADTRNWVTQKQSVNYGYCVSSEQLLSALRQIAGVTDDVLTAQLNKAFDRFIPAEQNKQNPLSSKAGNEKFCYDPMKEGHWTDVQAAAICFSALTALGKTYDMADLLEKLRLARQAKALHDLLKPTDSGLPIDLLRRRLAYSLIANEDELDFSTVTDALKQKAAVEPAAAASLFGSIKPFSHHVNLQRALELYYDATQPGARRDTGDGKRMAEQTVKFLHHCGLDYFSTVERRDPIRAGKQEPHTLADVKQFIRKYPLVFGLMAYSTPSIDRFIDKNIANFFAPLQVPGYDINGQLNCYLEMLGKVKKDFPLMVKERGFKALDEVLADPTMQRAFQQWEGKLIDAYYRDLVHLYQDTNRDKVNTLKIALDNHRRDLPASALVIPPAAAAIQPQASWTTGLKPVAQLPVASAPAPAPAAAPVAAVQPQANWQTGLLKKPAAKPQAPEAPAAAEPKAPAIASLLAAPPPSTWVANASKSSAIPKGPTL